MSLLRSGSARLIDQLKPVLLRREKKYAEFVKESQSYKDDGGGSIHGSIQWADTLPCRFPALFRPSMSQKVGYQDGKDKDVLTSKILFVLYASMFEEINRVRKGAKPNSRRIELLGNAARTARSEVLRIQSEAISTHGIPNGDKHKYGNIFDIPLRELGRLLWSRDENHEWWFNIQRKDDNIMRMMLEQFHGHAQTMLTTPLGFGIRVGSYHSIRLLIEHKVCSPIRVVSYLHINEGWTDENKREKTDDKKEKQQERCMDQVTSIKEGYFLPAQYIFQTQGLRNGVTGYQTAIVSKQKQNVTVTKDQFEKILQLFRTDKTVQNKNTNSACKRTMSFHHGIPEFLVILTLIGFIAYRYSGLWGGVSTLQYVEHMTTKFTDEPFDMPRITFDDVATVGEFYSWVEGNLLNELYGEEGSTTKKMNPFLRVPPTSSNKNKAEYSPPSLDAGATLLVGVVRIRQLRLAHAPCKNSVGIINATKALGECLIEDRTNKDRWSREPFGHGKYEWSLDDEDDSCTTQLCAWRSGLSLHGRREWGEKYPLASGYMVHLPLPSSNNAADGARALVRQLKSDNWIDVKNGTRVVFVNLNLYNPSLDLILSLRLTTEFFSSGGASTSYDATVVSVTASTDVSNINSVDDAVAEAENSNSRGAALAFKFFVHFILVVLFLWRTIVEVNDLAWGQAHGMAYVVEEDDFGQWLVEKTGRRPTLAVSEVWVKRQFYRKIKEFVLKRDRAWRRKKRRCYQSVCCCCGDGGREGRHDNKVINGGQRLRGSGLDGGLMDDEESDNAPASELGCIGRAIAMCCSSVVMNLGAFACCACCCGYAGGYNIARTLMRTRRHRKKLSTNWDKCCKSLKEECFCCCKLEAICISSVRAAAVAEAEAEQKTAQTPTLLSLLFSPSNDGTRSMLPPLTLSMWFRSVRSSKYLKNWWNLYEFVLVVCFWTWLRSTITYDSIKLHASKNIASAIDLGLSRPDDVPFVDLDHVALHATWAHDLLGALFIGMAIHSLKILSRVPFGIGTKVTAITSIFVHPEIAPFYLVLGILLASFSFGYFFAFGDEVGSYRSFAPSFKHFFLLTLMGAELPDDAQMEGSNIDFYYVTTIIVVLLMVLVLMNVFIAVVSDVYAKAQEESIQTFDESLESHFSSHMHPKLISQAELLLSTHHWPEVLERETSEVDDDVQPSTSADVQRLLSLIQKMDERQRRSELLVVDAIIPPGR